MLVIVVVNRLTGGQTKVPLVVALAADSGPWGKKRREGKEEQKTISTA